MAMKQNNNLWKFLFVVFLICWSFIQMYPPIAPQTPSPSRATSADTSE